MSNELIKKAYEHFDGVWPYGALSVMLFNSNAFLFVRAVRILPDASRENMERHLADEWQWVGTKSDFDAYGESLKVPEVGVEYEFSCSAKGKETAWTIGNLKYISAYTCVMTGPSFTGELVAHPDTMKFRPIKTEREKFIDQAIDDYLVQVGSDAVNPKWYGRIFGAMYDARYRKNET